MTPRKDRSADATFDAIVAELEPLDVTTSGPAMPPGGEDVAGYQDVLELEDLVSDVAGVGPATLAKLADTATDDLVRTAKGAVEWARDVSRRRVATFAGLCLMFVRMCFNVGPLNPDAITAWETAEHKHRCRPSEAPRARAGFFRGGSHGHVVLTLGRGLCYSSDIREHGKVDVCRLEDIERQWGYVFLGTTGDLNGEDPVPRKRASRRTPRLTDRQWRIRHLRRARIRATATGDRERARRLHRWLDSMLNR